MLHSVLLVAGLVIMVRLASSSGAHDCNDDSEDEASREEAASDSQPEPVDLWCEIVLWMNEPGLAIARKLALVS